MKVSIRYYPRDECMLATLIDQTVSGILDKSRREEREIDAGMREIAFYTNMRTREGRQAVKTLVNLYNKQGKKEKKNGRNCT